MAGLLDIFSTPEGMQGLALLGAAGPSMEPQNLASRLAGAGQAYQGMQRGLLKDKFLTAQLDETTAQAQERAARAAALKLEAERQARIRQAAPSLLGGGMTGGEPMPQSVGGVPMFSQPMGAAPMQSAPGGFNVQAALQLGMSPDEIAKYAGLQDVGRPKATRQMEVDDGKGGKRLALVDDYGREVAGFNGYVAPVQVNQGDKVSFVKPSAGVSLPVGMSPSERDASARGWAGNRLSAERLAFDKAGGADAGKAPAGFRWNADRTAQEIIPGGPADMKAGADGQKRVGDAKDVIGLLDEVDKLLPGATGSYLGAGVDQAARVFGKATDGAKATSQLKTLQGALIGKMPKMSGPQSDKDVQLYREMAGQVADPTLPVETRQAASATIRSLNEKYAGMPEGSSAQPKPAKQPAAPMKGQIIDGHKFKGGNPADPANWVKQ